ncbi:hypothetical protein GWI33_006269 [Rhynchophorus ferrugineus]|uniref:Uncharacterized protein n=1 Tax=Rhynchophorus ferrugineus TaxID=354439 RepID=A0A834IGC6_RHYFE|nr:hypothetical protein GWI33_006269 [Rhynchophorus ferrugineus]
MEIPKPARSLFPSEQDNAADYPDDASPPVRFAVLNNTPDKFNSINKKAEMPPSAIKPSTTVSGRRHRRRQRPVDYDAPDHLLPRQQ